MSITRPSYKECAFANMQALGAFVSVLIFQHFWSLQAGIFKYFVLFITGILVAKLGWQAVWNFMKITEPDWHGLKHNVLQQKNMMAAMLLMKK